MFRVHTLGEGWEQFITISGAADVAKAASSG